MAYSQPTPVHVTSFAEILQRLRANPVKAARAWHNRRRNSYAAGEPCDYCGHKAWTVRAITAQCGKCGNAMLKEHVG